MKNSILTIMLFAFFPLHAYTQEKADTIEIATLKEIELISDLYTLPHPRYQFDTYCIAWRTDGVDPQIRFNRGDRISADSKMLFSLFKPGDVFVIKEVFALNTDAPEKGPVKMPEKKIVLK